MVNHYYLTFQESKVATYCVVFIGKKMDFFTFSLNVNERGYSMKVVYTKLILIEMKQ